MTPSAHEPRELDAATMERLSAYVDGELTAAETADVEALLATSAEATAYLDRLRQTRSTLRAFARATPSSVPTIDVQAVVAKASQPSTRHRFAWLRPIVAVGGLAAAASLTVAVILSPPGGGTMAMQTVADSVVATREHEHPASEVRPKSDRIAGEAGDVQTLADSAQPLPAEDDWQTHDEGEPIYLAYASPAEFERQLREAVTPRSTLPDIHRRYGARIDETPWSEGSSRRLRRGGLPGDRGLGESGPSLPSSGVPPIGPPTIDPFPHARGDSPHEPTLPRVQPVIPPPLRQPRASMERENLERVETAKRHELDDDAPSIQSTDGVLLDGSLKFTPENAQSQLVYVMLQPEQFEEVDSLLITPGEDSDAWTFSYSVPSASEAGDGHVAPAPAEPERYSQKVLPSMSALNLVQPTIPTIDLRPPSQRDDEPSMVLKVKLLFPKPEMPTTAPTTSPSD